MCPCCTSMHGGKQKPQWDPHTPCPESVPCSQQLGAFAGWTSIYWNHSLLSTQCQECQGLYVWTCMCTASPTKSFSSLSAIATASRAGQSWRATPRWRINMKSWQCRQRWSRNAPTRMSWISMWAAWMRCWNCFVDWSSSSRWRRTAHFMSNSRLTSFVYADCLCMCPLSTMKMTTLELFQMGGCIRTMSRWTLMPTVYLTLSIKSSSLVDWICSAWGLGHVAVQGIVFFWRMFNDPCSWSACTLNPPCLAPALGPLSKMMQ